MAFCSGAALADGADLSKQVASCWNVGGLPARAQDQVVSVAFELDQSATPITDSLRLIGAGKDTRPAVLEAYAAARRAILRCGRDGYGLPLEKYDQWRRIEMTFNPKGMQIK